MAQITLRDYLQETEDAISAGRIDDALTHCQNILAQFPESLEAQRLLGEVYLAQGQLEDAQQSFDWVLTNDPENVVTYCDRALISERMSDYDTALDCYQQAYELSRGNSQIRREFNTLSAKAGQQGFMFSRAGLARLYMRGDLLTQAIQEWEVVLTANPERLDARTALLETYWCEELYDRVELLATQILQDVPGCVKALVLLAYVTSVKNMQQAQEILQRAEALDPDLLMAQELFADMMVSQPAEPFLQLLKKQPAMMGAAPVAHIPAPQDAFAQTSSPVSTSADTLHGWSNTAWASSSNWQNDVYTTNNAQEAQHEPTPLPIWANDAAPTQEAWNSLEKPRNPQQDVPDFMAQLGANTQSATPWDMYGQSPDQSMPEAAAQNGFPIEVPGNSLSNNYQQSTDTSSWDNSEMYDQLKESGDIDSWKQTGDTNDLADAWASSAKEKAAPAWLSMLTQSERQQLSGAMPPIPPAEPTPPPAAAPEIIQQVRKEEPKAAPIFHESDDDDDAFSFGPEWLKSLGAASIEEEGVASSLEPTPAPQAVIDSIPAEKAPKQPEPNTYTAQPQTTYEPVQQQQPAYEQSRYEQQQQPAYEQPRYEQQPAYEQSQYEPEKQTMYDYWASQVAESGNGSDQSLLSTLEELEAGLRSQGFIPLEPNSLSAIAQKQEFTPTEVPKTPEIAAPMSYQEPALSSALAELGNFVQQSSPYAEQPDTATEEPSWLAALSASPALEVKQEANARENTKPRTTPAQSTWSGRDAALPELPSVHSVPQEAYPNFSPAQPSWSPLNVPQEPTRVEPTRIEPARVEPIRQDMVASSRTSTPQSTWSKRNEAMDTQIAPAIRLNTATPNASPASRPQTPPASRELESELETTMKRPAVRLQPLQQPRSAVPKEAPPTSSNRKPATERPATGPEENISHQERLLKGYQRQLAGNYDEAMQEYRIVIRNAPQLLGDVVSNVRALLKIAPKYSTGYRVLGDAYMRQGEYLQAMESYNKALTMAKRAKG